MCCNKNRTIQTTMNVYDQTPLLEYYDLLSLLSYLSNQNSCGCCENSCCNNSCGCCQG